MPFKQLIYLSFFLTFFLTPTSANAQWEWTNPKPSGLWVWDVLFINKDKGFCINDDAIIVTRDNGTSWEKIYDVQRARDIDFFEETLVVVGDYGSVYRSENGGETWTRLFGLNSGFNLHYVKLISSDLVYSVSQNYFHLSTNGGQSWNNYLIPSGKIKEAFFLNQEVGHVGCFDGTILKTTDGGLNWYPTLETNITPTDVHAIQFVNEQVGFASRGHHDILKTIDGGENWEEISSPIEKVNRFFPIDDQKIYAATDYRILYITEDGGQTWELRGENTEYLGKDIFGLFFHDEQNGFAVGEGGIILKTNNAGVNWKKYSATYLTILNVLFTSPDIGYAITREDVLKTVDGGNSWVSIFHNNNFTISGIHFTNNNEGIVIGDDRVIYKTKDGGTSWTISTLLMLRDDDEIDQIEFKDNQLGFLLGSDFLIKTVNGGESWKKVYNDDFRSFYFLNGQTGFISGGYGSTAFLIKTTNGGESWTQIAQNTFQDLHFTSEQTGFGIDASDDQLYQTTDGGINWHLVLESYNDYEEIQAVNDLVIYAIGNDLSILKSNDAGNTWSEYRIPDGFNDLAFLNSNIGVAINDSYQFYKTINGGITWEESRIPGSGNGIIISPNSKLFISGENGTILRDSLRYAPFFLSINPAEWVTHNQAYVSGIVASNGDTLQNVRFVLFGNAISLDAPTTPQFITPNTTDSIHALLIDLKPNHFYRYQILIEYQGALYSSDQMDFTTLPDIELKLDPVLNVLADEAYIWGRIKSREGDVTNIQLEYGLNGDFTDSILSSLSFLAGEEEAQLKDTLPNLRQDSEYSVRLKVTHKGIIKYSEPQTFRTAPAFQINLHPPQFLEDQRVHLTAYVIANDDTIKNIVFEFDTTQLFSNILSTQPDQILPNTNRFVEGSLHALDPEKIYYYRLRGILKEDTIYSNFRLFRINGGPILVVTGATLLSPTTSYLYGLGVNQGNYTHSIVFEYGTTTAYGLENFAYPFNLAQDKTIAIQSYLISDLIPNTQYHFRLKATANETLFYSEDMTFTTPAVTAIDESENNLPQIILYPNPTNGIIQIKTDHQIQQVLLYDIKGSLLEKIHPQNNNIDISSFPNGIYLLKVKLEHSIFYSKITLHKE
ncbi:MAG: YCF48-related protein [Saprospiraceae bacterium]